MMNADTVTNSMIFASLHGQFDSMSLTDIERYEDCASFVVNGYQGFMMLSARGEISLVLDEGGEATFNSSDQFWSRNPSYPTHSAMIAPKECIQELYNRVCQRVSKDNEAFLKHLFLLSTVSLDDGGYLPLPDKKQIQGLIENLVRSELLFKHGLSVIDGKAEFDFSGSFIRGEFGGYQFEITQKFDGNRLEFDVHFLYIN